MTTDFAVPAVEPQATESARTPSRDKRKTNAPALTRLDLLFRKFGNAPQDVLLRKVITDYRLEARP